MLGRLQVGIAREDVLRNPVRALEQVGVVGQARDPQLPLAVLARTKDLAGAPDREVHLRELEAVALLGERA